MTVRFESMKRWNICQIHLMAHLVIPMPDNKLDWAAGYSRTRKWSHALERRASRSWLPIDGPA